MLPAKLLTLLLPLLLVFVPGILRCETTPSFSLQAGASLNWLIDGKTYAVVSEEPFDEVDYAKYSTQPLLSPSLGVSYLAPVTKHINFQGSLSYERIVSRLSILSSETDVSYKALSASLLASVPVANGFRLGLGPQMFIPLERVHYHSLYTGNTSVSHRQTTASYVPGLEGGIGYTRNEWSADLKYTHSLEKVTDGIPEYDTRRVMLVIGYSLQK
jgi:hypothetical protein